MVVCDDHTTTVVVKSLVCQVCYYYHLQNSSDHTMAQRHTVAASGDAQQQAIMTSSDVQQSVDNLMNVVHHLSSISSAGTVTLDMGSTDTTPNLSTIKALNVAITDFNRLLGVLDETAKKYVKQETDLYDAHVLANISRLEDELADFHAVEIQLHDDYEEV